MPTLLVTGFGPFPGMPRNPSAAAALEVAASPRWRILGIDIRSRILTTSYAALATELAPALAELPDAVLLIGVAGRSRRVRVEQRATSRRSQLFPDASGERPRKATTFDSRRTLMTPVKALRELRAQRLPSRLSRDAGRYLCNASYFQALAAPVPVIFIHIPRTPRADRPVAGLIRRRAGWTHRLRDALTAIGLLLVRESRNRVRVESRPRLG